MKAKKETTLWFTSDTHFGHTNIIKHSQRPYRSVEHMDSALVAQWNMRVAPDDEVMHLGDFVWSMPTARLRQLRGQLNGRIHLVPGNHDRSDMLLSEGIVDSVLPLIHELNLPAGPTGTKQSVVLCHYPIEEWNRLHRGAIHLHGHCHGRLPSRGLRRLDVGVDVHDYRPISMKEVLQHFPEPEA